MKHTEGDWRSGYKGKSPWMIWVEDVGPIADVSVLPKEWMGNAQLIAAAPKMYGALLDAQSLIEASAENQSVVMAIHEALAKAEGKAP